MIILDAKKSDLLHLLKKNMPEFLSDAAMYLSLKTE
jgi:hypothetical protein